MKLLNGARRKGHRFVMPVSQDRIACYVVGPPSQGSRKGSLVGVVGSQNEAERFLDGALDVGFLDNV